MKTIAIISDSRKHEAFKDIHEWLIHNDIEHVVSANRKNIFLKVLNLVSNRFEFKLVLAIS